jgi:CCR4-NOT transcriptional regulation complex NOT5 subunit
LAVIKQLCSFENSKYTVMREERLKKKIKAMYRLRDALKQKHADDKVFKFKSKSKILIEVDEIIDRSLEEFYSFRVV